LCSVELGCARWLCDLDALLIIRYMVIYDWKHAGRHSRPFIAATIQSADHIPFEVQNGYHHVMTGTGLPDRWEWKFYSSAYNGGRFYFSHVATPILTSNGEFSGIVNASKARQLQCELWLDLFYLQL
jgi:hypothetical protein